MRVTGGELKGRQLLSGFANHVRPSTDRVRESLFNSLQNKIDFSESNILDLFSGSGIIALEFLSRKAKFVTSVDVDKKNVNFQKTLREEWHILGTKPSSTPPDSLAIGPWDIIAADVWKYIPKIITENQFDLIFADPPYHMPNLQQLPHLLIPVLNQQNPNALLLIEHKPQIQFPITPSTSKDYGSSIISFFQP